MKEVPIYEDAKPLNETVKKAGRLIGLDVGRKRIGVAICDETRLIASPKLVINRESNVKDFAKIQKIITENNIVVAVIGLPLQMNGEESEMSQFVRKFINNFDEFLEQKFPLFLFDERLTSFEARKFNSSNLSRQKNNFCDDIAASLILQGFIDNLHQS